MIKLLLRNRINSIIGTIVGKGKGNTVKKSTRGRKIGALLGFSFALIVALAYVIFFEISLAEIILPKLPWLYYGIFSLLSFSLTFFLSIFETKSELFECKDNELLLSMPIRSRDILASRLLIVLIYNYLSDLIFMIPAVIIYGIYTADILGIIGGILVTLIIPFLTSSLSAGIGYIVARLSKKFKSKTMMSVIFFLVFFGAYMFFIDYAIEGVGTFIEGILLSGDPNAGIDTFIYKIGSISLFKPLNFIVFVLVTLVVFAVAFVIISVSYSKLLSASDKARKYVYVKKSLANSSAFVAFAKKEFKRLFSSSTYLINSAIGVIMPLFVCGSIAVTFISNAQEIGPLDSIFEIIKVFAPLIASALALFGGMTYISSCSLSLEGSAFWHIKAMPISSRTVLLSKTVPQLIISLPFSLITTIVVSVILKLSFLYSLFVVLVPIAANVFFAFFGMFMNSIFPRFDYESEAHVVKRSASSGLTMLFQMFITIGIAVGTFFATQAFADRGEMAIILLFAALLGVYLLLAFLSVMAVLFISTRKLDRMNV